ncbi:hypothetical protein [Sinorhizobium sp. BG8]|uniref:hypothetical protein n=1 Tax=Sinorhizobium sp. BG8 TaxID=2613773 RepID=UPI00193EB720|nr:hypothetical protein [Sinorhizobium sp. BG8]QRM55262.1 hypothetical protein F3Y30_12490 [Sinorhizobium sp. BG8]
MSISGLLHSEEDTATAQMQALQDRLTETKKTITRQNSMRRALYRFAGLIFLSTCTWLAWTILNMDVLHEPIWGFSTKQSNIITVLGITYSFFIVLSALLYSDRGRELDAKDLEDEIDLRQMGAASLEQKAHKLLRIQQNQLSRYLELILQQSRGIFFVGIGAMVAGVAVVVLTIWQTRTMGPEADVWQKAIVAVVGSIGAIMTNFVAAIYLKMFSNIGSAVQKSISSLSQSTNLNFANVLIANITTEEARNETLKAIAEAISKPNQS